MEDVARLAGVSHQTVSRVLNAHPHVSAATRARVERAIADLGYRRNTAARSLVTRRSQAIGVLGAGMGFYGPANTLLGVQQAAREQGYSVSMASLSRVTPSGIRDALEHFMLQPADGIVVIAPHETMLAALRSIDVPVPLVTVGFGAAGSGADGFGAAVFGADGRPGDVAVDQAAGAAHAVRHLLDLGHTSIAHISGPPDWIDAAARTEGWRHTLAGAGLAPGPLLQGDWSAGSGYRAGLELAASAQATAVFAANDQMALGALRAFSEAGLRVPEDMSVVGFDDQPEAAYFVPPLTTVNQGFKELGARCIGMLLADIEGGAAGTGSVLSPGLVVRASTAPR
ncbi:LacI family DNA-binding transcriptional regulator [Arthrobacter celericrescens]|uniref:LacI family DNA-binding transcriptional regulator n=1 Tax=Arthrobacter celericrescens TaxID=2320851 RepID=UPI000EA3F3A2|nr:LacI family DNA-binding transcriptional regulator [Arthrobacter celericrescens]